jgi:hypothetical protein
MTHQDKIEIAKLVVSIVGFAGTLVAFIVALRQYKRSEQWKRGEFVAEEIKEFESNQTVRNAFLMIDWSVRKIKLDNTPGDGRGDIVSVTREMQTRALLPHTIKPHYDHLRNAPSSPSTPIGSERGVSARFTPDEARIRDTYDVFLDYLERFANFIKSGLVSPKEFEPYLSYWINSIAGEQKIQADIAWRLSLLTFIDFYEYDGVQYLFGALGKNIKPGGHLYRHLLSSLQDEPLKESLLSV